MDEATTTPEVADAGAQAQPDEQTKAAESQTEETQPDPKGEPTVDANAEAEDHSTWLKNKGIDPSDPDAVHKAADAWRKAEQGFHQGRQEAKTQLRDEAINAVTTDNQVLTELNQMKVRMSVTDFYSEHPDAKELDGKMAEIVKARPYLAADLEAVYALASTDKSKADIKAAEQRGREAAKNEIARASTAKTPTGNAQNPSEPEDEIMEAFRKGWNNT